MSSEILPGFTVFCKIFIYFSVPLEFPRAPSNSFEFLELMEDNYHSVALKLASGFKWISKANEIQGGQLKWVLKLDDDVLLNLGALQVFIEGLNDTSSIYCYVHTEVPRESDIYGKW